MQEEAQKGLDWRKEFGRGGTAVGISRARDIVNGKNLSESTVKRMYSFFSRHEVDKKGKGFRPGGDGYPSNGRIAWSLWGGDAGFSWSKKIRNQIMNEENRAAPDALKVGDFVSWNSAGGRARGKIESIERDGKINIPDSDFTVTGTPEDPAALIRVYRSGEPSDTLVGHKFSTLTKISEIRVSESALDQEKHPVKTEEKPMEEENRHILNVNETDNSVIVEYSKHEDVEEGQSEEERPGTHYDEEERFVESDLQYRTLDLSKASYIDEEKRLVRIGVSSENPVERKFGTEVLSHDPEHIDMEFMKSGRAPLLLGHNHDDQIGRIVDFNLDEENARTVATVEFGKSQRASEVFEDVKSGIRQNVSVGYLVKQLERMKDHEEREYYLATNWMPMEASIVAVGADNSRFVGVGRSQKPKTKVEIMSEDKK